MDGLLDAPAIGDGELVVAKGAKETGVNGAGDMAGDIVNGSVVSLCTGDRVDPSGAKVAEVGA